ncbi:MAG: pyridoxal-dependent decarboxylase [Marinilabiliales bacterium]|nr:pyridoxal-dependent decarboxylase [Marinilabiliales bacterium]
MKDFDEIIMPGITHWQSPSFFAYFPANSSPPSVLAEMLTAALGAQCMIWETSPAAAELEERMMEWLREMTGLPSSFEGVIQDSASSATLVAMHHCTGESHAIQVQHGRTVRRRAGCAFTASAAGTLVSGEGCWCGWYREGEPGKDCR